MQSSFFSFTCILTGSVNKIIAIVDRLLQNSGTQIMAHSVCIERISVYSCVSKQLLGEMTQLFIQEKKKNEEKYCLALLALM